MTMEETAYAIMEETAYAIMEETAYANAKRRANNADSETLISLFERAVISYQKRLMNSSQESAERAYARCEAYREELLRRLGK